MRGARGFGLRHLRGALHPGPQGAFEREKATAFPSFQKDLEEGGALLSEAYVVRDGQFLTGRGMGVATQFGLALVEALVSREKAQELRAGIQWQD